MKKFIFLLFPLFFMLACQPQEEVIYISKLGDRVNPGTRKEPVATFNQAIRRLEEIRDQNPDQDVRFVFADDWYPLDQMIRLDQVDMQAGEGAKLTLSGKDQNGTTISAGQRLTGWTVEDGIWCLTLDDFSTIEQLFVNGRRAVRARVPNLNDDPPRWYLDHVNLVHEKDNNQILQADLWVRMNDEQLNLSTPGDFEVVIYKDWATMRKKVVAIDPSSGRLVLAPPHVFFEGNYNGLLAPYVNRFTCYLEGHKDFIDQPGEWAFDTTEKKLYYKPLPGEAPESTVVIAPRMEVMMKIQGLPDQRIGQIAFENLTFAHAGYELPAFGHDGRQACFFYNQGTGISNDQAILPSAIEISWAENLSFTNCAVRLTGGNGMYITTGSRNITLDGCEIEEIGGNGLMIGMARDPGDNSEELVQDIVFENGEVTKAGRHFDSAVGIWLGFARSCQIVGNEVHDLPYTGISVGWQWNPLPSSSGDNLIADNHIYQVMQMLGDGGGIYTLGNQPGSVIRNNEIHDILRSELNHASPNNGMFIDEGSKNFLVEGNHIYRVAHTCIRGHRAAGVLLKGNTFERGEFPAISHTPPYGAMIFADQDSTISWPNPGWPPEWGYPDSVIAFTMEGNIFLPQNQAK